MFPEIKLLGVTLADVKRVVKSYREENNLPTEGVGAGTAESRAGEVATHAALRMLKEGKTKEEVIPQSVLVTPEKEEPKKPEIDLDEYR